MLQFRCSTGTSFLRIRTFGTCSMSVLNKILSHRGDSIAVTNSNGSSYSYAQINKSSRALAHDIRRVYGPKISTLANFNSPGSNYVIAMLAAWHLGAAIVPLCTSHTATELKYFVEDSRSDVIISTSDFRGKLDSLDVPVHEIQESVWVAPEETASAVDLSGRSSDASPALILYTSGTTGQPKGVVHTFGGLSAMVSSLVGAWEYSAQDRILHFLPLHHLHGVLNKLLCTLHAGGHVEFLKSASAAAIWRRLHIEGVRLQQQRRGELADCHAQQQPVSLLMAVPTIYSKLLEAADLIRQQGKGAPTVEGMLSPEELDVALLAVNNLRLAVSGSAAMPPPLMERWHLLAGGEGDLLLERFGMTEIGMGLSNLCRGERVPGSVGVPLPGVTARLVDEGGGEIVGEPERSGELRIKGAMVFREYLGRKEATAESFDADGWFKTGDIARRDEAGRYYILGRNSMDIIKVHAEL
jgi:malonyl-CoA/methylmalonyl-CoA synthetase